MELRYRGKTLKDNEKERNKKIKYLPFSSVRFLSQYLNSSSAMVHILVISYNILLYSQVKDALGGSLPPMTPGSEL